MRDVVVFKYEDIVLRRFDLDTLSGPCFLTDQIIAFYFTYLSTSIGAETDVLLFRPDECQLIANRKEYVEEEYVQSCKIPSKRVVVFVVNDGVEGGNHWSILVYDRMTNLFLHFDSMKGTNNIYAEDLYNAVKEYMGPGGEVSKPQASSSSRKKQRNKKKSVSSVTGGTKDTALAGVPEFRECETPQQTNNYDCGLYVLAIAREICQWCSHGHNKSDMISTIQKNVDNSVELKMREEILEIIKEMTTDS
ncbi:hypothetical protein POM88_049152 [Heracleum sosnowskyi]|uniref:Ubiquitin-like protease family profile domain-containing protein n=1 Tax=Heracleum sosnowskyi TaxID=360622 RepID=A0AAD8GWE9_9APIA|nr:hypothetical protein POM88_049152 [Heracleum sosnowskyi]